VRRFAFPFALLLAGLPATLRAQAAEPEKPWSLTADLGLVNTAGNTNVTTVNVREGFTWRSDGWGVTQTFNLLYSQNEGETTANLWQAGMRGDRRLGGGPWRAYGLLTFTRNPFAGVDWRFEETVGVLVRPIDTARDSLEFDLGLSLSQQAVPVTGERLNFGSARLAAGFRHFFREKAYVLATATALPNLQHAKDVRFFGEVAVGAPLTRHFALKVSYSFLYDNVPDDGADADGRVDRFLTASVQVRF
jgi:putative salt-induced outer membrane protein YdiY